MLNKQHDKAGPDKVPADYKACTRHLVPKLHTVTSDGSSGIGQTKGCATIHSSPKTCTKPSNNTSYHVSVHDTKCVVKVALQKGHLLGQDVHGEPRNRA